MNKVVLLGTKGGPRLTQGSPWPVSTTWDGPLPVGLDLFALEIT